MKTEKYQDKVRKYGSPPSRRRGLKKVPIAAGVCVYIVASFAEAWIENLDDADANKGTFVASFAEAWIENTTSFLPVSKFLVASFAEAWIENWVSHSWYLLIPCRLLRGGVD